jgi:hypothetical protein
MNSTSGPAMMLALEPVLILEPLQPQFFDHEDNERNTPTTSGLEHERRQQISFKTRHVQINCGRD